MKNLYVLLLLVVLLSCTAKKDDFRTYIDLSGKWQFSLDTADTGIHQKWYLTGFSDSVDLPGTTDLNHKGFLNKDTTTLHLNRVYQYEGAAWYRKKVVIPEEFQNKHIQLSLERTKSSMIWIDTTYIGHSRILQSPQQFDLTECMTPGEHFITIRIDNRLMHTPYGNVHIYSDDTQTNWNGIIGRILLEATSKTYISNLQVYPDIDSQKIDIELEIDNRLNLSDITIALMLEKNFEGKITRLKSQRISKACESVIHLKYILGRECSLWDEYRQPIFNLTVVISNGDVKDSKKVTFGMRKFSVNGTQFSINGRTTFLRGKNDACVFPLTGHPPMDAEGWAKVFSIAKSYGINHYRYHSYCPPEAAFIAADQAGIYIQAELPFWWGLETDSIADKLKEEGIAMLKAYANHPSFVMFSHGNEIWSGHDRVERNIMALKEYDSRPLYTMGSNNNIGYVGPRECSDFFVGARTPYSHDTVLTHTRLTHAFADSRDGGILNTQTPSTLVKFTCPVTHMNIPVIGHETGQYQIFPDYNEIKKYTGVLKAWNFEVFRNRLNHAGMSDQVQDFRKASGAWSALCYKAEMEAAIRTQGFGGFQLLDLQDFPGQGTALVGILDAFMDSKNVISREEWVESCNDVVLLLEFPKYCWANTEKFQAKVRIANYSNQIIRQDLLWEIKNQSGVILKKAIFSDLTIHNEGIQSIGDLEFDLSPVKQAEKLIVSLSFKDNTYSNDYPVWIYPKIESVSGIGDIIVTDRLTEDIIPQLQHGASVLLFPSAEDVKEKSLPGLFPPEFWNYGMFKGISEQNNKPVSPGTLGILTNPDHPVFNAFPTDIHTNWQWFSIIKAGNSFILDNTEKTYRPIVQVIDNLERNHKLGLIFEFRVGEGKLMVCMSPLNQIMDKPEALQLYQSIVNYMNSKDFNPVYSVSQKDLRRLFRL
ncbi:MAG: beta-glycosidase [Bacteroidales bacterium]|nr:beta-glycosidase [Bacteroidales bacterium]MBN2762875.1 beta-glycosidase [Bacteroidales bacterium]